MIWFEKDIEVRYADTDQMGVIHHAVHPIYCELSRLHICDALGIPYPEMEAAGYYLMVAKMSFRYLAPGRFGEKLYVRGGISRLNKRLIDFVYEIRNRDEGQLLCTGSSSHVVTRRTDGPGSMPPAFLAKLAKGVEPEL